MEMRTGNQEAPETRKRLAETVAERLKEEATIAEAAFRKTPCTETQSRG